MSTSLTVVVGTSASPAITVVCWQALPLPPNATARRNAAARVLRLFNMEFLLRNRRILKSQAFARLHSLGNQSFVAALARDFHRRFFEFRSTPHIRNGPSCLPEKSIRWNYNPSWDARHSDSNSSSHSWRKPGIASRQAKFHSKIPGYWPSCAEIQAGGGTDRVHKPVEAAIRKRIEP